MWNYASGAFFITAALAWLVSVAAAWQATKHTLPDRDLGAAFRTWDFDAAEQCVSIAGLAHVRRVALCFRVFWFCLAGAGLMAVFSVISSARSGRP